MFTSKKWVLLIVALLGVSLLFMAGCDGKDSDGKDKSDKKENSAKADKSDEKDKSDKVGSDLIGPEWVLTAMADNIEGAEAADLAEGREWLASITFNEDGMYFAQAPVNTVRGPYLLAGDNELVIEDGAMTQMAGIDDEVNNAEHTFIGLLQRVASYKIAGNSLSLYDDAGNLILGFKK